MDTMVRQATTEHDVGSIVSLTSRSMPDLHRSARKRIMVLSTWHPVPADNGRKQRTLGLIDALRRDHDVILLSLLSDVDCDEHQLAVVDGVWFQSALPLPVFRPRSYRALAGSFSRFPRSAVATWNPQTAATIADLARSTDSSVVIGTDLRTLQYLRYVRHAVPTVKTILDEPDVSPFVDIDAGFRSSERFRARLRRRKYKQFLHESAADLDTVLVASPSEASAYQRLSGGHIAHIVGNGVHRFPDPWRTSSSTALLYTGSLAYGPNLEAVTWYARTILPLLRPYLPSAILNITGTLPDVIPDVVKQPSFRLTGRLDDLDAIYQESGVFVAPILSGTGTRIKILEAMAVGMPVVTTSKGCEGIPLVPGEHALVADTPEAFTLAILRILNDSSFAQALGARGRAFVAEHGTWDASAARFRQIVSDLLAIER